jgi:hypothetical protein
MNEEPLKSAYELAMERLQAQDRAQGVEKHKPLTEAQKEQIAELRRQAKARHAELEILHRKNLNGAAGDPEALTRIESEYERDRLRVESSLESALVRVRRGEKVSGLS